MGKENKSGSPLIHCITNPIAMNQSANAVLALGAKPIMAEHPLEVKEITETAAALLLNFGNISDSRMEAMKLSIQTANKNKIPVVMDVVGVACSNLRLNFFNKIMENGKCSVIKGNYSEILALYDCNHRSCGVDARAGIHIDDVKNAIIHLSEKFNAIILGTGEVDLIGFGEKIVQVTGGCSQLSTVTGTGCMLGAIIATYLAYENTFDSVEKACSFFKECGVRAQTEKNHSGTFMVNLMDAIGEHNDF